MQSAAEQAEERTGTSLSSGETATDDSCSVSSSDEEDNESALGSMGSLEEFLPIKRGLSRWFSGQSRSFASLAEAAALGAAENVAKAESPINKRRRIRLYCDATWRQRAEREEDDVSNGFRGGRSLSLADLQRA